MQTDRLWKVPFLFTCWYFRNRYETKVPDDYVSQASQQSAAGAVDQQVPEHNSRYPGKGRSSEALKKVFGKVKKISTSSGNWWWFLIGTSQLWQINKVRCCLQPISQNFNQTFWGHRKISIIFDSIWKGDLSLWVDKGYFRLGPVSAGSCTDACGPWPAGTIHNLLDQTVG